MMHVAGHGRIFELIAMNRFSLNVNVALESFCLWTNTI